MPDKLLIENGQIVLTTDEGRKTKMSEDKLVEMLREEIQPPMDGIALPDGVKFVEWRSPFMCVVHQLPAHVRQLRWITDDSPLPFGSGAEFQSRRLSMPYALTFAMFVKRGNSFSLMGFNELYFRNEPLRSKEDKLGYPALLNVSRIDVGSRSRAWICTQYLRNAPSARWDNQLGELLNHTWNGAFNRSSEHHEGASWFGESKGIHRDLHPVEKWEKASKKDDTFALKVTWKPVSMNVGQLIDAMLNECQQNASSPALARRSSKKKKAAGIVARFMNRVQQSIAQ